MKHLIAFPISSSEGQEPGELVILEVDEVSPPSGTERVARYDEILYQAKMSFETAVDHIKPVAEILLKKLTEISPNELTVEFGIKANAETGAIISSVSAEANFKVVLKWVNRKE